MSIFSKYRNRRQDKYQRKSDRLKQMRAAKARKRMENPPEHEPRMIRTTCLSIGFRDDLTGEAHWIPLESARQAHRVAGVMLQEYRP